MSSSRRDLILDAALERFGDHGCAATPIADIEAAAGLAPGTGGTYRHFSPKQAILEAVIERELAANDEGLEPTPESLEGAASDRLA